MTARDDLEWLEPDGLGGFASGTAPGRRTCRYHALQLTAATPPTGRVVPVNGFAAWVRGGTADAKREARRRFLEPLHRHLGEAGLGHVSEVAGADPPRAPKGCPFQAWSVGEPLRLDRVVLAARDPASAGAERHPTHRHPSRPGPA